MTFTPDQIAALKAPLASSHVKQRAQAGRQLSYIEGWHAIDEANRIFGYDKWVRDTMEMRPVCEPYQDPKGNWRIGYMAKVRIVVLTPGGDEVVRDGSGYGSGIDKDLGSAHESAIKEAETDAMKRALMTFGNPFGLALYDKEQRNVVDDAAVLENELEEAMTSCETMDALKAVPVQRASDFERLPQAAQARLRAVYKFKAKALQTFGEAA